jgi:hypothetical protein
MKSLFDAKGQWTDESRQLDGEFSHAIGPVFKKWADLGYSLRDVHYIALQAIQDAGISLIIARS